MSYHFYIDRFDSEQLAGWIFDTDKPEQQVALEFQIDGQTALKFRADQLRDDLVENGVSGHGRCGFDVTVADLLAKSSPKSLELRVANSDFIVATRTQSSRRSDVRLEGLWVDRDNFLEEALRRKEKGLLTAGLFYHCVEFAVKGYTIFEKVISEQLVDRINADIDAIWADRDSRALIETYQDGGTLKFLPPKPQFKGGHNKLVDVFLFSSAARKAIFHPTLGSFLKAIFEEPATAIQSLNFIIGSEQAIHKDTAFVVVSPPLKLVASWMALQDISPGTGELEYFVGSHRDPHYLFGNKSKGSNPYEHEIGDYLQSLQDDAQTYGHKKGSFHARKGDVLIWHADLAHGGSKILHPGQTRKSLVTHYCPRSAKPYYCDKPHPSLAFGEHLFTSGIYAADVPFRVDAEEATG